MKGPVLILALAAVRLLGQEASSGFDLRTTLSGAGYYSPQLEAKPRSGEPYTAGFRAMLYPTWRISKNWTAAAAVQLHSRPYFYEEFATQGYGVKADLLQAHISYSRFWSNKSLVIRAGQLSSAFGSFLLRYDDADNPLIDMPQSYGYYYKCVTVHGLAGAQADVTLGKVDLRAQFVNSSPANRRSVFDKDQYGSWAAGGGYTLWQGFRVGASAYGGAYLHRQYAFYFPGEAKPSELPAYGYGIDVSWGRGPWNATGEMHWFLRNYRVIPNKTQNTGYAEVRRVLHPRWYIAGRAGYLRTNIFPGRDVYEGVVGFRPNRIQLMKIGYQAQVGPTVQGNQGNTFAVQLVTTFRPISIARD
jgi:hypothetical protein